MKNFVKIPMGFILEMDDVGWIDGRDYTEIRRASRSGLCRDHCIKDYEFLRELTRATGKNIAAALVVGDWDKDNFLRGEVGFTHDPYGWDQKSKIDVASHRACLDVLEDANVDYMLHGVLHGRYDETGGLITECEHLLPKKHPDGTPERCFTSEEDLRRRLDMFFKIYNAWGLKKPVRGFVIPCGARFATEETVKKIAPILYEYGIRYWADSFKYPEFDSDLKVYSGVACFRWRGNKTKMPWDKANLDPDELQVANAGGDSFTTCLHGSHWTNFLNLDPDKSIENLPGWVRFLERQSQVFGSVNASDLAEAVNQLFYYEYAKVDFGEDSVTVDLSKVMEMALDCHKNEFFLSVKKGKEPVSCEGGTVSLWETKSEFKTYKICHTGSLVKIRF